MPFTTYNLDRKNNITSELFVYYSKGKKIKFNNLHFNINNGNLYLILDA